MLFDSPIDHNSLKDFCQKRREHLHAMVREKHPEKPGSIMLFAGFERSGKAFEQDSSFYYYTGVKEPGSVLEINHEGKSTLYVPHYDLGRAKWVTDMLVPGQETADRLGFHACEPLGAPCNTFMSNPYVTTNTYATLLAMLEKRVKEGKRFFTVAPEHSDEMSDSRASLERLCVLKPEIAKAVVDISSLIGRQRRKKDRYEIGQLYLAVAASYGAQEAAAMACAPNVSELEVRAAAEYILTMNGADTAYATVVAVGNNATTLHHTPGHAVLKKGDLVLVDVGGKVEHYCGDLTRTFPVGGKFSKRQREIYEIVLATQEHVAAVAKPGMWLSNKEKPEQSLHHIACAFLKDKGYAQYFTHGIGHFLGLDVHDVGDKLEPLAEGDVFTIEPGIYIPEENIGIRIEDDYWMVKDGVECLSDELPKDPDAIEKMMQELR